MSNYGTLAQWALLLVSLIFIGWCAALHEWFGLVSRLIQAGASGTWVVCATSHQWVPMWLVVALLVIEAGILISQGAYLVIGRRMRRRDFCRPVSTGRAPREAGGHDL